MEDKIKEKDVSPGAVGMAMVISTTVVMLICIVALTSIAITWIISAY